MIERVIGQKISPMRLPSLADVASRRLEQLQETLHKALTADDYAQYLLVVEALSEEFDIAEIAAAAIKLAAEATGRLAIVPAEEAESYDSEPGMARLFVDIGRKAGLRPGDLVGAIANEAGVPGRLIGAIDIYDTFSFVEVPDDQTERVITALGQTTIKGLPVKASIARPERAEAKPPKRGSRPAGKSGKRPPRPSATARRPAHRGRR